MVKTTDEGTRKSEIQRADELVRDETFRALVKTAIDAHSEKIRHEAVDVVNDKLLADVHMERAELEVAELLLTEQEKSSVYKVISTRSANYIKFAPTADVVGERLNLFGPPTKREEQNPVWQLSVRVSRPELDPYKHTPEEIVVDNPEARVTIMPERVYLDERGDPKFRPGTGVTINLYTGGRAEVFGAKGAGNILYTTEEPIATIEGPEISAMMEKLL